MMSPSLPMSTTPSKCLFPSVSKIYNTNPMQRGPWPKPHTDKAHAQIGDGSDGRPPTIADSQDTK